MEPSEPTIDGGRSKRQKIDRKGRGAAFEKLKALKGQGIKHKYEVSELDNVYDTVDEREYSKKVLERQDDDWIIDDDGAGYVEDGREIFDDDLDSESVATASKQKSKTKKSASKFMEGSSQMGGNIRNMFANISAKKPSTVIRVEDDEILAELLEEIDNDDIKDYKIVPRKCEFPYTPCDVFEKSEKNAAREYMQNLLKFDLPTVQSSAHVVADVALKKEEAEEPIIEDSMDIEVDISQADPVKNEIIETPPSPVPCDATQNGMEEFWDDDFTIDESVVKKEEPKPLSEINVNTPKIKTDPVGNFRIDESTFLSSWDIKEETPPTAVVKQDKSSISMQNLITENSEQEKVLPFFWWDAYDDPFKAGCVYLFGKVFDASSKQYSSCCLAVRNIERRMFLLPRKFRYDVTNDTQTSEPVAMLDVYNEFNTKFSRGLPFRSKQVQKSYCFTIDSIPKSSQYLEVRHAPEHGRLLKADTVAETFEHVFGTNTNFLETFLLDRKLKGPCWLHIKNPKLETNPVSWCKVEISCDDIKNVVKSVSEQNKPPPPLVLSSIVVKTLVNEAKHKNEIVIISCLSTSFSMAKQSEYVSQTQFCAMLKPSVAVNQKLTQFCQKHKDVNIKACESERCLLSYFMSKFIQIDPDIIIGHDLIGEQLDILFSRLTLLKINTWSRLGKLRRKVAPQKIWNIQSDAAPGRLVCDLKISGRELIKARSYDLNELCVSVLKFKENQRSDYDQEEIRQMYASHEGLLKFVSSTMMDANYVLKIIRELNAIPLAIQITNITGYILSKTFLGGRSERNEFLLLHAFTEKDYIVPDKFGGKPSGKEETGENTGQAGRKKPSYAGGLVLEPKVGLFSHYVLLMDFNSLYPSIIQEYNICFTRMPTINADGEWSLDQSRCAERILPAEIRKLVESRKQVKKMMKDLDPTREVYAQYNIRQTALKLTANSMYGCLGFVKSRFYAKPLAAMITKCGRDILKLTKDHVERSGYEVVYGDTDSLMINTKIVDYDEVFKIGLKIKQDVNKMFKHIELEIDGVFKYLLLLKKKKYAAQTVKKDKSGTFVYQNEIKGLDVVRRDWSRLAAEAGNFIIENLLSDQDEEVKIGNIYARLAGIRQDLEASKVPILLLTIAKQLTKDPSMYVDKKSLPHVQIAIRFNTKGGKRLRRGDTVQYVICDDGSNLPPMQRAYHVDEFKASTTLKIDAKYYITQQILPLVIRLCVPIQSIKPEELAKCLGVDGTTIKRMAAANTEETSSMAVDDSTTLYATAYPFTFMCVSCETVNEIKKPFIVGKDESDLTPVLERCANKDCHAKPLEYLCAIENQLTLSTRKFVRKYYQGLLVCEDPNCDYTTTVTPQVFSHRKHPICRCEKSIMYAQYSAADLQLQLAYFSFMFDVVNCKKKPVLTTEMESAYARLKGVSEKFMKMSKYAIVSLWEVFGFLKENKVRDNFQPIEDEDDDMM